jgi:hypothetical protein
VNAEELLAAIESLRVSMATVQATARKSRGPSDVKRAAQSMGMLVGGKLGSLQGEATGQMLHDLSFHEPNERGVRPFDRFLSGPALTLSEREQDIARRMGQAVFSIFRLAEKHEIMGTWVEDVLNDSRRIWLIDLDVPEPEPSHSVFAARIFDAGPFHAMLSVITSMSDRIVDVFKRAETTGHRPYRRSLAATIYGLTELGGLPPTNASARKFVAELGAELRPGDAA